MEVEQTFDDEDQPIASTNGWLMDSGAALVSDPAKAASGTSFIALGYNTNSTGSGSQSFDTRAGGVYKLTFSAKAFNVAQTATINVQSVDADGVATGSVFKKTTTVATGPYATFSVTFTATSDTTLLTFSTAASMGDLYLDDVSVSRVAGKQDEFSDAAQSLDTDAYIAGSDDRMSAAKQDLGKDFTNQAMRRWWGMERYDGGLDSDTTMFDARAYSALNPLASAGSALDQYFALAASSNPTKLSVVAPRLSAAAMRLDADAYLAASPTLIQKFKTELGTARSLGDNFASTAMAASAGTMNGGAR